MSTDSKCPTCMSCGGNGSVPTGTEPDEFVKCKTCNGTGKVTERGFPEFAKDKTKEQLVKAGELASANLDNSKEPCYSTDHIVHWVGDGYFCIDCGAPFQPNESGSTTSSNVKEQYQCVSCGHKVSSSDLSSIRCPRCNYKGLEALPNNNGSDLAEPTDVKDLAHKEKLVEDLETDAKRKCSVHDNWRNCGSTCEWWIAEGDTPQLRQEIERVLAGSVYEWREGWRFCDEKYDDFTDAFKKLVVDKLGNHPLGDYVYSDDCACQIDAAPSPDCGCICHQKTVEFAKQASEPLLALFEKHADSRVREELEAVANEISEHAPNSYGQLVVTERLLDLNGENKE